MSKRIVAAAPVRLGVLAVISVILAFPACAGRGTPAAVPARPLGRDIPVYRPLQGDAGRPEGPAFENPTETITLRDALALALLHGPDLAAFAWETRSREAGVLQAGRLPNPAVAVLTEDIGASTPLAGGQLVQPQTTVQLSQLIELGGKRTARHRLAVFGRDLAAWDYEATRIDVLTQVTRAFVDVLVAQEMLALTGQSAQLVEQVQQTVGARVVAGVVSPIEETRADVALAAARVEAGRAVRLLDASRGRLAAYWGVAEPKFRSVTGDLGVASDLPALAELTSRLAENPDRARWAAEISQRQAALSVERSKRVPDLTLTMGYRRFTGIGSNAFVVGGSINLPVFDWNGGAIAEAQSRLARGYEERRAAEARTSATLGERYRALSSAHEEVTVLRATVLPGSQQTFEAVSEGYRLGKFGYLDVLDAQRTFIAAGGQYLRAVSDYHKALADVEGLIGAPLNGASNAPE